MYKLVNASVDNIELIKNIKIEIITASDNEVDNYEELIEYVDNSVKESIDLYKLIIINGCISGIFLKKDFDNYTLIDEIYIYDEYRKHGIASDIIRSIDAKNIHLWVYKNNESAINLYKKSGFNIIDETNTRFRMKKEN